MSFSEKLKNEILSKKFKQSCCKIALISGFLRSAGSLDGTMQSKGVVIKGFEFATESILIRDYIKNLIIDLYGEIVSTAMYTDPISKKDRHILYASNDKAVELLKDLGIISVSEKGESSIVLGIDKYVIENDCCKKAYILGVFLAVGVITVPKIDEKSRTGYHLEFAFSNNVLADEFCHLLSTCGFFPKNVNRKSEKVVYFNNIEDILSVLAFFKTMKSYFALEQITLEKDIRNDTNRIINCEMSNLNKQVEASLKQIKRIEQIENTIGLDGISPQLKVVAIARKENPDSTLDELSKILGITKSCLNHRLRKLVEIAENLTV